MSVDPVSPRFGLLHQSLLALGVISHPSIDRARRLLELSDLLASRGIRLRDVQQIAQREVSSLESLAYRVLDAVAARDAVVPGYVERLRALPRLHRRARRRWHVQAGAAARPVRAAARDWPVLIIGYKAAHLAADALSPAHELQEALQLYEAMRLSALMMRKAETDPIFEVPTLTPAARAKVDNWITSAVRPRTSGPSDEVRRDLRARRQSLRDGRDSKQQQAKSRRRRRGW